MKNFFKKYWKTILFVGIIGLVMTYEILNWKLGLSKHITDWLSTFGWWTAFIVGLLVAIVDPLTPLAMGLAIGIFHVLGVSTWWLLIPDFIGVCFTVWLGIKISKKTNTNATTATIGWISFIVLAIMDFEILLVIICARYLNAKIIWAGGLLSFTVSIFTLFLPAATTLPGNGFPMIVFAYILSFTVMIISLFIKPLRRVLSGELAQEAKVKPIEVKK